MANEDPADQNPSVQDEFPEIAFFEVPVDKTNSGKTKELVKNPAFREISAINGQINRLSLTRLKFELDALGIDCRGTKDVLRKRLKTHERRRLLDAASVEDPNNVKQHYTHLLVIDFEATCEEHQDKAYVHEIIEFPVFLIKVEDSKVIDSFHSFVKPVLNPTLSPFCCQLTGITQSNVDEAETFPMVLKRFQMWLVSHDITTGSGGSKLAVVTDGPWDMARFLLMQCSVSKIPFPLWARSWINIRKVFSNFYDTKRLCLSEMIATLGLEFEGRPHCGLDDARNIAAITEVLLRDGAALRVNETMTHLSKTQPPPLTLVKRGSSVSNVTLKDFESSERRRQRASEKNCKHSVDSPLTAELSSNMSDLRIQKSLTPVSSNCNENSSSFKNMVCNGMSNVDQSHNTVADPSSSSAKTECWADDVLVETVCDELNAAVMTDSCLSPQTVAKEKCGIAHVVKVYPVDLLASADSVIDLSAVRSASSASSVHESANGSDTARDTADDVSAPVIDESEDWAAQTDFASVESSVALSRNCQEFNSGRRKFFNRNRSSTFHCSNCRGLCRCGYFSRLVRENSRDYQHREFSGRSWRRNKCNVSSRNEETNENLDFDGIDQTQFGLSREAVRPRSQNAHPRYPPTRKRSLYEKHWTVRSGTNSEDTNGNSYSEPFVNHLHLRSANSNVPNINTVNGNYSSEAAQTYSRVYTQASKHRNVRQITPEGKKITNDCKPLTCSDSQGMSPHVNVADASEFPALGCKQKKFFRRFRK